MTSVGERPRQREVRPSLREILRRPSSVEVKVFWRAVSTAQSANVADEAADDGASEGLRAV